MARLRAPATLLLAIAAACGDDADVDADSGETTSAATSNPTTSTTSASSTSNTAGTTTSNTDDTSVDESGPEPVMPGEVIDSRSFYEIGADADISDLATSPAGDVYALLDAHFPEGNGWQLHRLDGGLWTAPNAAVITFDAEGNIYCVGRANLRTDFGGGTVTPAGESDVAIVKRTPDGAHVYTRLLGGTDSEYATQAGVDVDGNLLVGGVLRGSVDLGAGPFVSEDYDRFVLRLDADGEYLGAIHLDDDIEDPSLLLAATATGHVVIVRPGDTIDVGGTVVTSNEPGTSDIAALGFDSDGALAWNQVLPIAGEEAIYSVVVTSNDEIALLAGAEGDVDLGTGTSVGSGAFVVLLDSTGMPSGLVDVDDSVDADIAVDDADSLALTGTFGNFVVQRLEPDGTPAWLSEVGGTRGTFVTFDADGNVVVAGTSGAGMDGNFNVLVFTLAR